MGQRGQHGQWKASGTPEPRADGRIIGEMERMALSAPEPDPKAWLHNHHRQGYNIEMVRTRKRECVGKLSRGYTINKTISLGWSPISLSPPSLLPTLPMLPESPRSAKMKQENGDRASRLQATHPSSRHLSAPSSQTAASQSHSWQQTCPVTSVLGPGRSASRSPATKHAGAWSKDHLITAGNDAASNMIANSFAAMRTAPCSGQQTLPGHTALRVLLASGPGSQDRQYRAIVTRSMDRFRRDVAPD